LRPGKASEKTPKGVIPPSLCEISQNASRKKSTSKLLDYTCVFDVYLGVCFGYAFWVCVFLLNAFFMSFSVSKLILLLQTVKRTPKTYIQNARVIDARIASLHNFFRTGKFAVYSHHPCAMFVIWQMVMHKWLCTKVDFSKYNGQPCIFESDHRRLGITVIRLIPAFFLKKKAGIINKIKLFFECGIPMPQDAGTSLLWILQKRATFSTLIVDPAGTGDRQNLSQAFPS
jgi:hypothetical protein